jgi:hypothetical protein
MLLRLQVKRGRRVFCRVPQNEVTPLTAVVIHVTTSKGARHSRRLLHLKTETDEVSESCILWLFRTEDDWRNLSNEFHLDCEEWCLLGCYAVWLL